jgi:hypothetical protein
MTFRVDSTFIALYNQEQIKESAGLLDVIYITLPYVGESHVFCGVSKLLGRKKAKIAGIRMALAWVLGILEIFILSGTLRFRLLW